MHPPPNPLRKLPRQLPGKSRKVVLYRLKFRDRPLERDPVLRIGNGNSNMASARPPSRTTAQCSHHKERVFVKFVWRTPDFAGDNTIERHFVFRVIGET